MQARNMDMNKVYSDQQTHNNSRLIFLHSRSDTEEEIQEAVKQTKNESCSSRMKIYGCLILVLKSHTYWTHDLHRKMYHIN